MSGSDAELHGGVLGDEVLVLVELSQEGLSETLQLVVVFLADFGQGDARSVLEANELAEGGLALDDGERSVGGSAQFWQPANQLDWVAVGGNDDELGDSVFN